MLLGGGRFLMSAVPLYEHRNTRGAVCVLYFLFEGRSTPKRECFLCLQNQVMGVEVQSFENNYSIKMCKCSVEVQSFENNYSIKLCSASKVGSYQGPHIVRIDQI